MSFLISSLFIVPLVVGVILCFQPKATWYHWVISTATLAGICGYSCYLFFQTQSGLFATTLGGWPTGVGITLVVDGFSALMLAVSALIGTCVLVFQYSLRSVQKDYYYSLILFLFAGVNGAFITGDLFNLYVCFEIMVMSSFVLFVQNLENDRVTSAIRYVSANLFSSLMFLTGVGLIYGVSGRLNLAELSLYVTESETSSFLPLAGILLLFAFSIKSALFPVFHWLPHSYPAVPPALGALFAGLLTKVGIYAIFRVSSLLFPGRFHLIQEPLLWIAVATMLTGVLAAASQKNIRSILSYHIISQVGYMVLGIAVFTLTGFIGAIFYLLHHIVAKSNLFLICAVIEKKLGSSKLADLGGLAKSSPWLAASFLAPALALAGIPPFSGFFAKFLVIKGTFEIGSYVAGGCALLVGLITFFSMSKIWNAAFWSAAPKGVSIRSVPVTMAIPVLLLSCISLLLGLGYPWIVPLLESSAEGLLDHRRYISAVLGGER